MANQNKIVADLAGILGERSVSGDIFVRTSYALDPLPWDLDLEKIPVAVVKPQTASEVSEVVKYAKQYRIPLVIHGSGTNFVGGSRPIRKGSIVLSTSRLDSLDIYEEDTYFESGSGVNLWHLEQTLAKRGYFLPMNIGNKKGSTIGGAVAVNTIGHMVDAYVGKVSDYLLGLEVVLPTGEIIETGTKSLRKPAGFDFTRFFAGSEGLFGVITKLRMELIPDPKKAYVAAFFEQPESVGYAFTRMYHERLPPPLYGEFMDQEPAEIGFELRGLGKPKGAMALATAAAHSEEEAQRNAKKILEVFRKEHPIEAYLVESPEMQEKLWAARDFILNVVTREKGTWVAIEVGLPVRHLGEGILYLKRGPERLDILKSLPRYLYGHVGACSVHALWVIPREWPDEKKKAAAKEAHDIERDMHLKFGGLGGEVAQMTGRIDTFKAKYGETVYSLLLDLKKTLDPDNILNPGHLEGEGL